jgi:hypothetical protein
MVGIDETSLATVAAAVYRTRVSRRNSHLTCAINRFCRFGMTDLLLQHKVKGYVIFRHLFGLTEGSGMYYVQEKFLLL